jgi:hypothetical protein
VFFTAATARRRVFEPSSALELAKMRLDASPHHVAVKVHEGGDMIARIERDDSA